MKTIRTKLILLILSSMVSAGLVVALYILSENRLQNENPFIRRYTPGAAIKTAEIALNNPYYYIAGEANGKLYLANHKAPLYLIETDTTLLFKRELKIELDRYDFPFLSAEVRIDAPYFYVYDGMVPIIYKGLLQDMKASIIYNGDEFFTGAVVLDSTRIAIRGQKNSSGENLMGVMNTYKGNKIEFRPKILEKQIDGFFDTSGTMSYSVDLSKFVYVYYFRNQFIVTNNNLEVETRGNTIDTISKAKLKIVKLRSSGDTKLAVPPITVNNNSSVFANLLFIHSAQMGQYEIPDVWSIASVVDVYDITKQHYLLSFYVYDTPKTVKMKKFYANKNAFYAIIGNSLQKYSFGIPIKNQFMKKELRDKTTGQ